ncbi:MAG: DnaD domain protein [Halanaerobiales bacterium]|nr:DnaD domain protein [Halanaerobiales bacterium]
MGNGRYIKIVTKIWTDEKISELSDQGQKLFIYILTSPHSNMAGYYRLPKPYIQYDLSWSDKLLDKPFSKLLDKSLIKYCEESSVVLIPKFFKYNSIQNKNQAKGAAKKTSELPKNCLVTSYKRICKAFSEQYYELLTKGLPKPLPNTETEAVTEKETEYDDAAKLKVDNSNQKLNKISGSYKEYFHHQIKKEHIKIFKNYLNKGMSLKVIIEAIRRSEGKDIPFEYCLKILHIWEGEEVYNLDDVKVLDKAYETKKNMDLKTKVMKEELEKPLEQYYKKGYR